MTAQILQQRAEIERAMGSRTICDLLDHTAAEAGDAPAFSNEAGDSWQTLTWAQTHRQVRELAAGFAALGLAPGERVALMLPNCTEHVLADQAAVHAGGLGVTIYATLAPEQIAFVAGDCDARIAVVDGAGELARWQPVLAQLPGLKTIIVRDAAACPAGEPYLTWDAFAALGKERYAADPDLVSERVAAITIDDPVALLYTSGTTGNPKGVLLTHRNVGYELASAQGMGLIPDRARWVSYLPLAHIAERMFSIYLPIHMGTHVHFCPDPTQLVRVVGKVRPNGFFGVPRVWEKIRAASSRCSRWNRTRRSGPPWPRRWTPAGVTCRPASTGTPCRPAWRRSSPRRTRRCSRRSAGCSAWARRRLCPAPRRRCRRRSRRSSPAWA